MSYVVKLVLESSVEKIDYKIFRNLSDAEDRYYKALFHLEQGTLAGKGKDTEITYCGLFETEAPIPVVAKRIVQSGGGKLVKSNENPIPEIEVSLEELESPCGG